MRGSPKMEKSGVVPVIEDMQELLARLRVERERVSPSDPVMVVQGAQYAMTRAAAEIGMPRITHHDLRNLFATRCIELGVDVPTVARWLGHRDGGALLMKTYAHLRDHHSVEMGQRVTFKQGGGQ